MMPVNYGPPRYPLEQFHFNVRETARELGNHLQTPDALIGMALLAVMSITCQSLINVKLATGQIRPVSLYILAIAESGERKSTLDGFVAKPLYDLIERRQSAHILAMERYEYALALWEDEAQVLQKRRSALIRKGAETEEITLKLAEHRKAKPVRPRMRQIVRHDLTGRAFADALDGDGESIALMSAEGDILLRSGAMKQLGWLNSAWDGSTLSLDRADGKGVLARNPRVTVSIMVQPSAFREHLARRGEQARGTGLLARFLVGWPRSTQGRRVLLETEPTWEYLSRFQDRAKQLLDNYDAMLEAGCVQRTTLLFTEEAKRRWIDFVNDAERLIDPRDDYHDISDFVSKMGETVGRIAAILHHFSEQQGDITVDTLERAITIASWHADEFQRLFSPTSDRSIAHDDAHRLARHLYDKVWSRNLSEVRRNDLLQTGPASLRTKRRMQPALDILEEAGAIRLYREHGGRCYVRLMHRFFDRFSGF